MALISTLGIARPGIAEEMTLEASLAAAYVSNPQLEAQRASLRATDEEVNKALAGWRPTLGGSGSYGWQKQSQTLLGPQSVTSVPQSEQITLDQPLFNGRTIPSVAHAKELVSAGREQLTAAEETVLFNGISAYFAVLRDAEIVEAYHEDVRHLRTIQENTGKRLALGELTKTDASQAAARLLGSQINLAAAEQQLAASRASFEHIIGRPAEALIEHALPTIPAASDGVLDIALEQNATLLQRRAEARAADQNVEIARGALLPSVSVQAEYGRSINTIAPGVRENGVSVLGQLNIPLYQGGAEEAGIRQAKEQSTQALLTSYDAERQVREDATNAWHAYQVSRAAAELAAKQAAANEVAYLGTTMESQVGSRNILDILNAEQELLQSKITAITEQQNNIVAAYRLLNVMGRLTAADLKLPVTLYDPAKHYDENATKWFGFGD
jgi:outer membrane protein